MRLAKAILQAALLVPLLNLHSCVTISPPKESKQALVELRRSIDAILADSQFISARAGIKIVSLRDGQVLYDRDSKALFHPGSNLKLLTLAAVVRTLGREYKYQTALSADSLSPDGSIVGNLYLKGFGNPDLKLEDLRWMVSQLRAKGIRSVTGDVVADVSYFDDEYWGRGWMWDDEPSPSEAFISPLSINRNIVKVFVRPGETTGARLQLRLEPETQYVAVLNEGITRGDEGGESLTVSRRFKERSNTIVVTGSMPRSARESVFSISVWRPELFAATLLKEELDQNGIEVRGSVRLASLPARARELLRHEWPIDSVLTSMIKTSENLSAENTLKLLAAECSGPPGSAHVGISLVKAFLFSLGIDTTKFVMVDGSGVSHYNLISPEIIVQLLSAIEKERDVFDLVFASLPIAGVDGTLENRMRGTAAEGRVRGKTGTLTGVSALSGYAQTSSGDLLAFSVMMEHFIGSPKPFRDAQDRIVEALARYATLAFGDL